MSIMCHLCIDRGSLKTWQELQETLYQLEEDLPPLSAEEINLAKQAIEEIDRPDSSFRPVL